MYNLILTTKNQVYLKRIIPINKVLSLGFIPFFRNIHLYCSECIWLGFKANNLQFHRLRCPDKSDNEICRKHRAADRIGRCVCCFFYIQFVQSGGFFTTKPRLNQVGFFLSCRGWIFHIRTLCVPNSVHPTDHKQRERQSRSICRNRAKWT